MSARTIRYEFFDSIGHERQIENVRAMSACTPTPEVSLQCGKRSSPRTDYRAATIVRSDLRDRPVPIARFTHKEHIRCIIDVEAGAEIDLGFHDDMLVHDGKLCANFEISAGSDPE